MKKIIVAALVLAAAAGVVSCKKDYAASEAEKQQESREMALLTVKIQGEFATKATRDYGTQNKEDMLSSVEIFVFDAKAGSAGLGMLEAYKSAEAAEILGEDKNTATIKFNTSTGPKHIYVIANAGKNSAATGAPALASSITTETELKAAISEFSDNAARNFIMAGAASPTLAAGNAPANNVSIEIKRLVARIKVGSVTGAFTSPALQSCDFKVRRIYLMNVPKQAKYVNGDAVDVFGVAGANALASTDALYPAGFVASGALKYYSFLEPAASASSENGMYSYMAKEGWSASALDALLAGNPDNVKSLTFKEYTSANQLYVAPGAGSSALDGHKLSANLYFYSYPNSSAPAASPEAVDNTTKVVIETELKSGSNTVTYYYPLSIPYVQPNYAYTIGDVKIKRLGSTDPFTPVSTAECSFSITVRGWEEGDITGAYNNETGTDDFEI